MEDARDLAGGMMPGLLPAVIAHRRLTRLRGPVRRMKQPNGIRLRYFQFLRRGPISALRKLLSAKLVPQLSRLVHEAGVVRHDAEGDLPDILDAVLQDLLEEWGGADRLEAAIEPFARDTARLSREELVTLLREHVGTDVLTSEPWLAPAVKKFTAENVALIRESVMRKTLSEVESAIVDGLHSGERQEKLAELIEERLDVTESRANLIARDQVGKLYGGLNARRQQDLGVTGFVWRTMRDNRVRSEHSEREGRRYQWDDPPDGEIPGEPINCRCYAEPDLGELFSLAEE